MKMIELCRIPCKAIFYICCLAIILPVLNSGCVSKENEKKPKPEPNLVIIGEDLSGTFDNFPKTTEEDLRVLCDAVAKSKWGGKVYFIGIGKPDPKGYVSCSIRPLKIINQKDPPSIKRRDKEYNIKIMQRNENEVETFIANASSIFQQHNQGYTDINSFFVKASSIFNTPNHKNYEKWLYVNSDGKQATNTTNKIRCDVRPSVDKYFVNTGWKDVPDCGAAGKLIDTRHFIDFFKQELEIAGSAGNNE